MFTCFIAIVIIIIITVIFTYNCNVNRINQSNSAKDDRDQSEDEDRQVTLRFHKDHNDGSDGTAQADDIQGPYGPLMTASRAVNKKRGCGCGCCYYCCESAVGGVAIHAPLQGALRKMFLIGAYISDLM